MGFTQANKCPACGYLQKREETATKAIASGVFVCLRCGKSAKLNLVIVDDEEVQRRVGQKAET